MRSRWSTDSQRERGRWRESPLPAASRRVYDRHYLLWDGECAFCRRVAQWVARNDRQDRFHVVPYQQAPSPPMDAELRAACAQALHVVRADGEALRAGAAVLFVLDRLGWCTAARLLGSRPLLPVVEAGYRWVAGHRALLARAFRL